MRTNRFYVAAVFAAACALPPGCSEAPHGSARHEGHEEDEGHGADEGHEGHGHEEEEGGDLAMSIKEILAARCEHDMLALDCDECRYEVGVVKVDPSLLAAGKDGGAGLIGTTRASTRELPIVIEAVGEVGLNENAVAHIAPRTSGSVAAVKVGIGAKVERGDPLLEVDSLELGQATAAYMKHHTMTGLARKNYERERSLMERNISPEKELIEAQMAYEQSRAELMAAEHSLEVLGLPRSDIARLAQPGTRPLGRLTVRAPFPGTITRRHATIGELVGPESDVLVLADLSTVWVWAGIYEHDIAALLDATGRGRVRVEIRVHALPERLFKGALDYVGAVLEETTRTVRVRASIPNKDGALKPGMFCKVRVLLASGEKTIALPKSAVSSDEGVSFVFKHLKDDYYVRRKVRTGRDAGDWVATVGGVEPGELVVTRGAFVLKSDVLRSKMGAGCAD